jgi:hypothetical protein
MARLQRAAVGSVAVILVAGVAGCSRANGSAEALGPAGATPVPTNAGAPSLPVGTGNCSRTSVGLTPLTDLGRRRYAGYQGGLYPGGKNAPPHAYLRAGLAAAARVRPLAANGAPSPSGRIVLLSIGMSNAYLEFGQLIRLDATGVVGAQNIAPIGGTLSAGNPHVELVNGDYPSWDARKIVEDESAYLRIVYAALGGSGVSPQQVQAVWLKEAIATDHPGTQHESFPAYAQQLRRDLDAIIAMLSAHFPNLRLIYISSRTYGGYAVVPINPEPYAYESGFAVKWTVAGRMAHPRARPWVGWGPYLWADGTHHRGDGLAWACSEFGPDGTHPSTQGADKVAGMLLRFFKTSQTTRTWFDKQIG